ncbi:AAA family ATPase [Agrobacterium rubi]|nr:AAA family ATPase [Agrobacterium rubi]NTF24373.1 AAA family ATPase [Agrobacterium rubi]
MNNPNRLLQNSFEGFDQSTPVAASPAPARSGRRLRLNAAAQSSHQQDEGPLDQVPDYPDEPEVVVKPDGPAMDELRGTVVKVIYRTADGYCVYLIKDAGSREHKINVSSTVVAERNDIIVARGTWGEYKGKPTFKAMTIMHSIDPGAKGVVRWLKNKVVAGVGTAKINSLAEYHGERLPEIMEDPAELSKAPKVSMKDAIAISDAWTNNVGQADLVEYLGRFRELGENRIHKIIKRYGAACKRIIEESPWRLAETIDSIGFDMADRIAFTAGHKADSPARIDAGVRHALEKKTFQGGHCAMPRHLLVKEAASLLKVGADLAEAGVARVIESDLVILDEERDLIYPPALFRAEHELKDRLIAMIRQGSRVDAARAEAAVRSASEELGVKLDKGQSAAAIMAVVEPLSIITGGPGTGKSTTQRVVVRALEALGITYGLAAPTGRAAKRLADVTGKAASTCHRLLSYSAEKGGFEYDHSKPFEFAKMIVDEFSMIDLLLANSFADAIRKDGGLLIVGDVDQLESVGAGQVLRDLIDCGMIPVARLETVHRQAGDSGIVVAAGRINTGVYPLADGEKLKGFYVSTRFESYDDDLIRLKVVDLIARRLPNAGYDPVSDIQVLAPYRDGELGINRLNVEIKAALNPQKEGNSVELKGRVFSIGDRVMHLRNDYVKKVYNGELGTVTWVGTRHDDDGKEEPCMKVDYSGFAAFYSRKDVDDVELSWAATVHKSQGCEFPVVIFVVPHAPRILLTRNLLYTAVTRAKKECIVIGSKDSINHAVNAVQVTRRHTGLAGLLSIDENTE